LAEYRDLAPEFEKLGAAIVAVSADDAVRAAAYKQEMRLPFVVLGDPRRSAIEAWDLLDPEMGGIAHTATFVLDPNLTVAFRSIDPMTDRVSAAQILGWLRDGTAPRRTSMWSLANFGRVGLSILKHGWLTPRPR
jgi:peroxiredoxin